MKKIFWILVLILPSLCGAINNDIEFDFVRTAETPGFFSVTLLPSLEAQPIESRFVFVKNFPQKKASHYEPILSFLTELGAKVVEAVPNDFQDTQEIVSLGETITDEKNFHITDTAHSLDEFEQFSLKNLKPVFFQNITAEFGGNISVVEQFQKNIIGDEGVTFIGKFEKDMRTRMAINAENGEEILQFDMPLPLNDTTFSLSPLAKELPELWSQLRNKKDNSHRKIHYMQWFPWIIGGIGIIFLLFLFIRSSIRKYNTFLEEQENAHEELPWKTVSQSQAEKTPNNPFELE